MKLKFKVCIFIFCALFFNTNSSAQTDTINYSRYIFRDLKEAIKMPDKVINLDLAGKKLKKFPPEILSFINLRYLNLSYTCDPSVPHNRYEACPGMKTNKLRNIPDEIINLKNLIFLDIAYNRIPCRKVEKLISLMPNCEIENTCFSVYDEVSEPEAIRQLQSLSNLEKALTKKFNGHDGLEFNAHNANIEKIDKPLVKTVTPEYELYKVRLSYGTCVVLYDSLISKIILVDPLWYKGISDPLLKLFIKKSFDSREKLLSFLNELTELMEIGSGYKFVLTSSTDTLVTYDLVYFKGDTYTDYAQDDIWLQIEIKIKDFSIAEYTTIKPH